MHELRERSSKLNRYGLQLVMGATIDYKVTLVHASEFQAIILRLNIKNN